MNLLNDIVTYIRRIIKSPNDNDISTALIIDYINRFWIHDVDGIFQLFDLKTKYSFITTPGVDQYNMPLYQTQIESPDDLPQNISFYPVYQGFLGPCYINGVQVAFQTQATEFFRIWPNIVQNLQAIGIGNGGATYNLKVPIIGTSTFPNNPPFNALLRGHVDITGIVNQIPPTIQDPPIVSSLDTNIPVTSTFPAIYINSLDSTGKNVTVSDSGQFLVGNVNYGLLLNPGPAPRGNTTLLGGYSTISNTVNYLTGEINVTFPVGIPQGNNINVQCYYFQSGLPRQILFYNNVLTLRAVPAIQYLVELEAYLTPAAFLRTTDRITFGYMSEFIARGAARKILADTNDEELLASNEKFFLEQKSLVQIRSQRQWTATRTETLYSQGFGYGQSSFNNLGGAL